MLVNLYSQKYGINALNNIEFQFFNPFGIEYLNHFQCAVTFKEDRNNVETFDKIGKFYCKIAKFQ